MKDPEIRALLYPALPPGVVINELEIRTGPLYGALTFEELQADRDSGTARADVVLVNDALHGYEIKGASDSRARLPRQVAAYSAVFDRCTLVTEPRHLDKALAILPAWWGVLVATDGAREHRPASANPSLDPVALIRLLHSSGGARILREHGVRLKRGATVSDIWPLAPLVPIDALRARVRDAVLARRGPGAEALPAQTFIRVSAGESP